MDGSTASVLRGTCVKFNPTTGTDIMMKGGVSTSISVRHQCITVMQEYELKSLEELRLEDYFLNYLLKKKAAASVMHSADATLQKGILSSAFSFPSAPATSETSNLFRRVQPVPVQPPSKELQLNQWELNFKHFQKRGHLSIDAWTQTEGDLQVSKLHRGLKEMLLTSKYSDFVLNVRGQEFRVHKMILEAHSPVFAAMMKHDTKEKATGVADIDDFEPHTIINFLEFLYTERVENLNSDSVMDLYEVADKYQVTELSDFCIVYMIKNISIENFCDTLTLSLRHHIGNLSEVATQFFLRYSKEIALTVKWGIFLAQNPVAGNELFLRALNLENK